MGSGLKSRKKRDDYKLPQYLCNTEEREHAMFCIRNNIRISPLGIYKEPGKWKIGINIGPYKRGEKTNVAPGVYDRDTIWPEYYKFCKYYYDKYRK